MRKPSRLNVCEEAERRMLEALALLDLANATRAAAMLDYALQLISGVAHRILGPNSDQAEEAMDTRKKLDLKA